MELCHNFLLLIETLKHIEKSLRHVTMVAKFLDLHKPWSCEYGRKKKRKMVAHTFLPSFENAKGLLRQERLFEIQKFCYYDNSPLLESKMAIK